MLVHIKSIQELLRVGFWKFSSSWSLNLWLVTYPDVLVFSRKTTFSLQLAQIYFFKMSFFECLLFGHRRCLQWLNAQESLLCWKAAGAELRQSCGRAAECVAALWSCATESCSPCLCSHFHFKAAFEGAVLQPSFCWELCSLCSVCWRWGRCSQCLYTEGKLWVFTTNFYLR